MLYIMGEGLMGYDARFDLRCLGPIFLRFTLTFFDTDLITSNRLQDTRQLK